jgi:hypothetical protein
LTWRFCAGDQDAEFARRAIRELEALLENPNSLMEDHAYTVIGTWRGYLVHVTLRTFTGESAPAP